MTRRCQTCDEWKPETEFGFRSGHGYRADCRACRVTKLREAYRPIAQQPGAVTVRFSLPDATAADVLRVGRSVFGRPA